MQDIKEIKTLVGIGCTREPQGLFYFNQMRHLKFRSYFKGKLIFPDNFDTYANLTFHSHKEFTPSRNDRKKMYIMQFIGSLDRNGNEIYESDILKAPSGQLFEVFWDEEEMKWSMRQNGVIFNINAPLHEVIGNIHQDTELLKHGSKD